MLDEQKAFLWRRSIVASIHLVALLVNLLLCLQRITPPVGMEQNNSLSEPQKFNLNNLSADLGPKFVDFLLAQSPDALTARFKNNMQYYLRQLRARSKAKWRRLCKLAMRLF